jgi:hypothetical protein
MRPAVSRFEGYKNLPMHQPRPYLRTVIASIRIYLSCSVHACFSSTRASNFFCPVFDLFVEMHVLATMETLT